MLCLIFHFNFKVKSILLSSVLTVCNDDYTMNTLLGSKNSINLISFSECGAAASLPLYGSRPDNLWETENTRQCQQSLIKSRLPRFFQNFQSIIKSKSMYAVGEK